MPAEGSAVHGRHCPSLLLSPVKSLQMTNPQGLGQGFYCIRFQTQLVFNSFSLNSRNKFWETFQQCCLVESQKILVKHHLKGW